jgi:hypothetical protein
MPFLQFTEIVSSNERVMSFLRGKGVLRTSFACIRCTKEMTTQAYADSIDGFSFRCTKCKGRKSIRVGSFLADCKLSLRTFTSLVYMLQLDVQFNTISVELEIDENTVTDYANLLREEYSRDLLETGRRLGGPGHTVQIDESLLAKSKRTRNNHARPVREQWVFGAYDVGDKIGWIQLVDSRDADTLLPLVREWCAPGTRIISDGWAAYNRLNEIGFEHHVVIHEQHFVDPETGLHTNNVEAYWQRCKRQFKRMYGTSRALLPSHVDQLLWRERFGKSFSDRWNNTLDLLKRHYTLH